MTLSQALCHKPPSFSKMSSRIKVTVANCEQLIPIGLGNLLEIDMKKIDPALLKAICSDIGKLNVILEKHFKLMLIAAASTTVSLFLFLHYCIDFNFLNYRRRLMKKIYLQI